MGAKPLQRVTGADVSVMLGKLTSRGKVRMAEQVYLVTGIIFNAAARQGAIGRSPMAGVERPRPERRELHVLSPDDWVHVREYLETRESWMLQPLALLLTTGLRRSELAGLQWGDVDFARGLLYVRRSYHSLSTGFRGYREPKTAGSKRAIALDGHTLDMLRAHRADAGRAAEMFGRPLADTAPLFTIKADGGPVSPDTLTGAWRRIAKALGLNVRLHDIRHSSATLLLAAGVPVQLVSQRLGHASAGFTLGTYAGVLPGAQHDAAEKLAALLDGGRNGHALPARG
jgi:integrase